MILATERSSPAGPFSLTIRNYIYLWRILFYTPVDQKPAQWNRWLVQREGITMGVLSFAVKRIGEIFQAGSHVYLEKPVALAFKPLGKIAGPDLFLIGWRFAIKIYK